MASRTPRRRVHANLRAAAHRDGTYDRLFADQQGLCAICQRPQSPKVGPTLDVDHCHTPGDVRIRGLLCRGCNMRLRPGLTAAWMRAAADYLEGVRHAEA